MERFADPNLIGELSTSEIVEGALITTLMGIGTTFVILTLLWGVIALVSKIINQTEKKPGLNAKSVAAPAAAPAAAPTAAADTAPAAAVTSQAASTEANTELIAVIAAAIAAMEGTSPNKLIVRKISRISGNSTAWSRAGASELIDSRKF